MTNEGSDSKPLLERGVLRGEEFIDLDTLRTRAASVASGLASLGIGPGDTVGMLLRNDHPYFETSFGAGQLGAAPVPINWHSSPEEVAYVLSDARARVLVAHSDLLRTVMPAVPEGTTVLCVPTPDDIVEDCDLGRDAGSLSAGAIDFHEWRDGFEPYGGEAPGAPTSMIYTSGTTGKPKGVRRIAGTGDSSRTVDYLVDVARHMGIAPGMRSVFAGPLYHSAPNAISLSALGLAEPFLVLRARFDPEDLLAQIERHRATVLYMVPTMFVRLLKLPEEVRNRYDLSSLQHISHTAAPCPVHVKKAMMDWLGPIVWEYYGSTEVGLVSGCDPHEWLAHPGTVGKAMVSCTIRVFDEEGTEAAVGEPGEIFSRAGGFTDFTYEGREDERTEIERSGLLTCGDVGYLDEDGFLYLCDRVRDMIISGGVNIYPAEIEACLHTLKGVHDCAVFGIPDEEFGESIAAAIELEPGATLSEHEVRDHVRAHLAGFKVPRLVEFHDALPREASGKMFKRKLREPHWQGVERSI